MHCLLDAISLVISETRIVTYTRIRRCVLLFAVVSSADALSGCTSSETVKLREEVDELSAEVAALRRSLTEANSRISTAAEEIENAQSAIGLRCRDLVDAVNEVQIPDEVRVPQN